MILFVDDMIEGANIYLEEMKRRNLPVLYFESVDDAWRYLTSTDTELSVAVVDIMMPSGDLFPPAVTSEGLTTGVHFSRLLKRYYPECFVFVLTNLAAPAIVQEFQSEDTMRVLRKDDIFYDELVDEVENVWRAGGGGIFSFE